MAGIFSLRNWVMKQLMKTDKSGIMKIPPKGKIDFGEMLLREQLFKKGINCRVISMHTIKPIDKNIIIDSVNETGGIVTLEEHSLIGGLGGAVSEILMQNKVYPKKFKMLGLKSKFSTIVGAQDYLRKINRIDKKTVVNNIVSLLK